ncbi:pro-resilin-like isoform X2 [Palaemon carinicauda]|uniref:pro-resilin-like isoform X2 n=1 Tax=Palaemon carinicauda TaxID=392227 RepID=UPI0035B59F91
MFPKAGVVTVILAVVGSAIANFNYGPPNVGVPGPIVPAGPVAYPLMPYNFGYGVADSYTGNDFGHAETSDGNAVKGSYYVLLPDGRKQVVTYTADYSGYNAEVAYEGTASFPAPVGPGPIGPIGPKPGYGK